MGLGAMMVGGRTPRSGTHSQSHASKQPGGDFYPTPSEVTEALCRWLSTHSLFAAGEEVWDPACGDGAIATHLEARGHLCHATDLYDRGYGKTGLDFLRTGWPRDPCPIITNPPYADDLPDKFVRHAMLELGAPLLALLLKGTYWHAGPGRRGYPSRDDLWRDHPPAFVLPLTWRVDFQGLGRLTMETAWNIWLPGRYRTIYDRLPRPIIGQPELFAEGDR